ncbi:hypothetical protein GO003_025750 [Methylicorpusculum oleiharenae]|uniref:hypothetical protein n=1 Tax=Methylicorpusculum oleiharenae TaxID=1338687 RepID=UPI00135AE1B6|nr:hypothetical protein [Methylicorpusculum oleiharenae]MCD2453783.1 hypothetical protein [Methylicorpusculum oleiharenae]
MAATRLNNHHSPPPVQPQQTARPEDSLRHNPAPAPMVKVAEPWETFEQALQRKRDLAEVKRKLWQSFMFQPE